MGMAKSVLVTSCLRQLHSFPPRLSVSDLLQRANRHASFMASDRRREQLGGDWSYAIDTLNRMQQVLAGRDVEVPPWNRRDPDWHEHSRPGYRERN